MASAVKDIIGGVLSQERIIKTAMAMKEASRKEIDISNEILKLPKAGMLKDEVEMVTKRVMDNDPAQGIVGKPTLWKLSQAITSVSNEIGERRKMELDELAGKLISL